MKSLDLAGPFCDLRSTAPFGKLACACSNAPEVYTCGSPHVASGYCIISAPEQTGDGPISVFEDEEKLVPGDARRKVFSPMPLHAGERGMPWDVVVCTGCPYTREPTAAIRTCQLLKIQGPLPAEGSRVQLVHVGNRVPAEYRDASACWAETRTPDLAAISAATGCQLLILHADDIDTKNIAEFAARRPDVKLWCILHGTQDEIGRGNSRRQLDLLKLAAAHEHVWYGTDSQTVDLAVFGHVRFQPFPPLVRVEIASAIPNPPEVGKTTIAIYGKDDKCAGRHAAVLAAGILSHQRRVRVVALDATDSTMRDTAAAAGLKLDTPRLRSRAKILAYLGDNPGLLLAMSDGQYTAQICLAAMGQGHPVIGSKSIRCLPPNWQSDPNDPTDIALVAQTMLDNYGQYSAQALQIAAAVSSRQEVAYHAAISTVLA